MWRAVGIEQSWCQISTAGCTLQVVVIDDLYELFYCGIKKEARVSHAHEIYIAGKNNRKI